MDQLMGASGLGWASGAPVWAFALFPLLALWGFFWKGLALWHSAQRGERWWFLALLLINTVGILEIVYLFAIAKLTMHELFTSKVKPSSAAASSPAGA